MGVAFSTVGHCSRIAVASSTVRYLRLRISSVHCSKLNALNRVTKKTCVPISRTLSVMCWFRPWMMAATLITLATPITTPSAVKKARSFWLAMVAIATPSDSLHSTRVTRPLSHCRIAEGHGDESIDAGLLGAEGDDRVETRRPDCRIDAENQSNHRGQQQPQRGDPELHLGGEGRELPQQQGQPKSQRDARQPAHQTLRQHFDQELPRDVALRRADGAPQADLLRALGDADERDVHDHDSADKRRDRRNQDEHQEKHSTDVFPEIEIGIRSGEVEVVPGIGREMAPAAQDQPQLVLDRAEGLLTFDVEHEAVTSTEEFFKRSDRHDGEDVLILAK